MWCLNFVVAIPATHCTRLMASFATNAKNGIPKYALVLALVIGVLNYSEALAQNPANAPKEVPRLPQFGGLPTPAWKVQEKNFQPGYYFWPAFGQTPADAKYCKTWDEFNKLNIEITGVPHGQPNAPRKSVALAQGVQGQLITNGQYGQSNAPVKNAAPAAAIQRHKSPPNNNIEVTGTPYPTEFVLKGGTPPNMLMSELFQPGSYFFPDFGQKPSDAKYCKTLDDYTKMYNKLNNKAAIRALPQGSALIVFFLLCPVGFVSFLVEFGEWASARRLKLLGPAGYYVSLSEHKRRWLQFIPSIIDSFCCFTKFRRKPQCSRFYKCLTRHPYWIELLAWFCLFDGQKWRKKVETNIAPKLSKLQRVEAV